MVCLNENSGLYIGRSFTCDMLRHPFGKHQAFQQAVAGQAVSAVNAVAAGLSHSVEVRHGGGRVAVHVDAAHEVMLCRDNGNRLFQDIIAVFQTEFANVRKVFQDGFPRMRKKSSDFFFQVMAEYPLTNHGRSDTMQQVFQELTK